MGCIGMACDTVGRANSPIRESLAAPSPPEQGRSTVDSLPRKAGKARFPRSSGFRAERGHRAGRSPRSRPKSTRLVLTGMRQLASCGAAATPVAAALLVSDKTGHAGRGNASGAHTTGSPAHRRKRGSPYGEQDPPPKPMQRLTRQAPDRTRALSPLRWRVTRGLLRSKR